MLVGFSIVQALAAPGTPAQAEAAGHPAHATIKTGEPAGFSNLVAPQRAVVDIYFGGKRLGDAQVIFQPGSIQFVDPDKLIEQLSDLTDAAAVRIVLAEPNLPNNSGLVCMLGSNPTTCGRLSPQVAGVIFDRWATNTKHPLNEVLFVGADASCSNAGVGIP